MFGKYLLPLLKHRNDDMEWGDSVSIPRGDVVKPVKEVG
jgi:hypothetical protein